MGQFPNRRPFDRSGKLARTGSPSGKGCWRQPS
jgi:hypothetical protein